MEKHLIYFIKRKEGKESVGRGALVRLVKQRKKTAMAMQMQMQMQMQLKFQDHSSRRLWRGDVKAPNTIRTSCVRITRAVSRSNGSGSDASASSSSSSSKKGGGGGGGGSPGGVPQSNYFVPLDKTFSTAHSSWMTRPLVEILRDLNKRIPDNIIIKSNSPKSNSPSFSIPWYHANRMLSFYAPGWCGEIRDVIYSENGTVTVVYRLTIRGSDGEAYRESSGTISSTDGNITDPVAAAEEIAFCRACARFGLGLYLYHEE